MPTTPLNFLAHLTAKPGCEHALETAILTCAGPTREEEGNINYDVHRREDDPAVFVIYEGWRSQAALDEHFTLPHFTVLMAAAEELVAVRGPDGKPFTAESLTMVSDLAPISV